MAKDPAFLFYPNDYIGGTMGMTFEEKGAYIELLMLQFNRGHMTSHMIGQTIGQLWDNIKSKFAQDDDGLYYNVRLELEINKRKEYTASRRNNISGVNQYTSQKRSYVHDMTTHMEGQTTSHMEDVNINENVDVNKKEKYPVIYSEVIAYLNLKAGTSYRSTSKITQEHIRARQVEGFTLDDFKKVIDNKCTDWLKDVTWSKFLRPETLFGNKFESYLNSPVKPYTNNLDFLGGG